VEGKFIGREESHFQAVERSSPVVHKDNLRMEGKFEAREKKTWSKGVRSTQVKKQDNLHQDGEFYDNRKSWACVGDKASVIRHTDNLTMEGKLEGRTLEQVLQSGSKSTKAQRTEMRREDNLKIEGEFTGKAKDFVSHSKGERASIVHHKDNLKMEGKMESRMTSSKAIAAEKASQIKHEDNLKLEGSMDLKRRGTITLRTEKENSERKENRTEQSVENSSQLQKSVNTESRYVSTSNLSQSSAVKANQSSGITGSILQSGKEEASITAVNRDKFASSLRESSGVILGSQKEMSVIENHRKQSLQKQKLESWDTRVTGYSVGEAHTGRTAAHGGRDYQYSGSSIRNQGSWTSQSQEVSRSQTSTRASRQEHSSGLSAGFKQEQISGYARNLGNSHSGSALIKADQVVRHEASRQETSSAYQSVAQQSYRAHQSSETRMERTTPSKRRTWAESSLMHGGSVAIGQSIYSQDFHQHSCPASKVYTNTSPYKYERQSSSGHKMFAPREGHR